MFITNYDLTVKNVHNLNAQLKEAYDIIQGLYQNTVIENEPDEQAELWLQENKDHSKE